MEKQYRFHQIYKQCPNCGTPLTHTSGSVACPACGLEIYHNPAVCVTLMLVREGQVLLGKRKYEPQQGMWDAPGGFVDAGETAEAAVIREMKEETNLEVTEANYLGSANDIYNGIPTLALLYEVSVKAGNLQAQDDVAELKWFSLYELPQEIAFSNTEIALQHMLNKYQKVT